MQLPKDNVYWYLAKGTKIDELKSNLSCDIAIVGGGMTGLSVAQAFLKKGFKVVLLEKDFCGAGASGKSSGFITPDSEFGLSELVSRFGKEKAKKLWEFGNSGVKFIRNNIIKNKIECDYLLQDAFFVANRKSHAKSVEAEYNARKDLGYKTKVYYKKNLIDVLGTDEYFCGARYYDTFVINGYSYCQGMKDVLKSNKAKIFEKTNVVKVNGKTLKTDNGHKVNADKIIVCTDRFIPELKSNDKDFYQVQTYLLVSKPLSKEEIKIIFPKKRMMVWDSNLNYQYFRPIGGNRLLMGGGDIISLYNKNPVHKNKKVFVKLARYFGKKFTKIKIKWEYMWPGMLGISKDFLPVIAKNEEIKDIYYSGAAAGLPWAAAIGSYLCDKITRGINDYDEFFSPKRKFPPVTMLQPILRKKLTFALSHGYVKFLND